MNPSNDTPALPRLSFDWPTGVAFQETLTREWLVSNGRGGYASGTVARCNTRRYHGLFVPGLEKKGRTVLLARLGEEALIGGRSYRLDAEEHSDGTQLTENASLLRAFHLDGLVPHWIYQVGDTRLQRKLMMVHGENTLMVLWEHLSGPALTLRLRPFPAMRPHDDKLHTVALEPSVHLRGTRVEMLALDNAPPMRMRVHSSSPAPFVALTQTSLPQYYRVEKSRGYDFVETLVSPGYFECTLGPGEHLSFGVTLEDAGVLERDPIETMSLEYERERRLLVQAPKESRTGVPSRLVLAADQFIIAPTRAADEARARAVDRRAHRHRRLPLVHGLGPRHDDLASRA